MIAVTIFPKKTIVMIMITINIDILTAIGPLRPKPLKERFKDP